MNFRDTRYTRPVIKAKLSEAKSLYKLFALGFLLLIAGIAFTYALITIISDNAGWTAINIDQPAALYNENEFSFIYNTGASGVSASSEKKALIKLYTIAMENAYNIYNIEIEKINSSPNKEIIISEELYKTLLLFKNYNNRDIFLGPVYSEYKSIFSSADDNEIKDYDITQNNFNKQYVNNLLNFINNVEDINLIFLPENKVLLEVSDSYLALVKENDTNNFVDLFWYKNAFIVDYLANYISDKNYTLGSISSFNGFSRNLGNDGNFYSLNLFNRYNKTIYPAGILEYKGRKSFVTLKNYKITLLDNAYIYEKDNGETITSYIDITDGLPKSSINELVSWSDNFGCGEILLNIKDLYISNNFEKSEALKILKNQIYSLYIEDFTIYYNDKNISIKDLFSKDNIRYYSRYLREI